MASSLQQLPIPAGGGLNLVDNPETLDPGMATVLRNMELTGRGRWTTRRAARSLLEFDDPVIGVFAYGHTTYTPDAGGSSRASAAVVLTWDSTLGVVNLNLVDQDGGGKKEVGTLAGWASVDAKPKVNGDLLNGVLFIVDEGKEYGLTTYDPNDILGSGATAGLFQPKFIFAGGGAAVMKARAVAVASNLLIAVGYGDETTPDYPSAIRFSYVGLVSDATTGGSGDAGDPSTTGSLNLFDTEDIRYLSAGVPTVGLQPSDTGVVLCTDRGTHRLYGTDRTSLRLVDLDLERGLAATRAITIADGVVYGMSQTLGPWRLSGGSLQDLSYPILPRLIDMDFDSMFAVHAREAHQVRWYYTLATERGSDPDHYVAFDYRLQQWMDGNTPNRVFCGGWIRPGTGTAGGGGTPTLSGPAGPPTSLSHDLETSGGARASWTNGDTSPGVVTKIYRAPDASGSPGTYTLLDTLAAGVSSYVHSGLAAETTYWTKVEHVKNGSTSTAASGSFTTTASTFVVPPQNATATTELLAGALVGWDLGQAGVQTEVKKDGVVLTLTATDATSYYHPSGDPGDQYDLRHKDASGNFSSTTSVTAT